MKNKHKLIYDPIFRSETLFYSGKNWQDIISHVKKKYKIDLSKEDFSTARGTCLESQCPNTKISVWIVWISNPRDWKTMVHEAAHLTFRILDFRGVSYGGMDSETWCYLHEYFISKFWHIMRN